MSRLKEVFGEPLPFEKEPNFSVNEVIIAGDLGPCGGVNMAIETTQDILKIVNKRQTVYANNEPVHNDLIAQEFKKNGLVIQSDLDLYKANDILLLSAHGTPPSKVEDLRQKGVLVVNTECQLVSKDRRTAERILNSGNTLLYIGVENHPEPKAVIHDLQKKNESVVFASEKTDLSTLILPNKNPINVLSQTTISVRDTNAKIKSLSEMYPDLNISNPLGECYATDNRQAAVYEMFENSANPIELLLVVGSKKSHNSNELRNIGVKFLGEDKSYLVDSTADLNPAWFSNIKTVGFTSGASVLDKYSITVLKWLQQKGVNLNFLIGKEDEKKDTIFTKPYQDIIRVQSYIMNHYEN